MRLIYYGPCTLYALTTVFTRPILLPCSSIPGAKRSHRDHITVWRWSDGNQQRHVAKQRIEDSCCAPRDDDDDDDGVRHREREDCKASRRWSVLDLASVRSLAGPSCSPVLICFLLLYPVDTARPLPLRLPSPLSSRPVSSVIPPKTKRGLRVARGLSCWLLPPPARMRTTLITLRPLPPRTTPSLPRSQPTMCFLRATPPAPWRWAGRKLTGTTDTVSVYRVLDERWMESGAEWSLSQQRACSRPTSS